MDNEQETITKEEAAATLRSVESTKRDAKNLYRQPLLLIVFSGLCYGLIVHGFVCLYFSCPRDKAKSLSKDEGKH